jgi:uncharacterized protein YndB with AHSA1/START domain
MRRINNADVEIRDRELVITKLLDAPRKLVYKAWTEPQHVKNWWGPGPFTSPHCEIDLKPGGRYTYVMRGPDGVEYTTTGTFMEIVANERLLYTDDMFKQREMWEKMIGDKVKDVDFSTLHSVITVIFEDEGDKTKLILTTRFISNEMRDTMVGFQMAEGWTDSLEKFAKEVYNA